MFESISTKRRRKLQGTRNESLRGVECTKRGSAKRKKRSEHQDRRYVVSRRAQGDGCSFNDTLPFRKRCNDLKKRYLTLVRASMMEKNSFWGRWTGYFEIGIGRAHKTSEHRIEKD